LSSYLKAAKQRGVDVSALALALQRKYVNPFSVLVMAFIGMPLALAFGRRGAIVALCVAVGVSVAYWGIGGGFQQLGNHGLLPPEVAAWAPPVIFAAAGTYFLSRVRTCVGHTFLSVLDFLSASRKRDRLSVCPSWLHRA